MANNYPSHYGYGFQPIPQQYQQNPWQGGGMMGGGMGNPQGIQSILAYLLAMQGGQQQQPQQEMPQGQTTNPYMDQPFRPTLGGLSPLGRFNDMALRQSASIANRAADGKQAVAESTERQRLVDSITHPPPMAPYNIQQLPDSSGMGIPPALLNSRYGRGSVSFAPSGTQVHGTFGPDNLPFGQIGGPMEGQPLAGPTDLQSTYQQQMILDSISKALGKKKK